VVVDVLVGEDGGATASTVTPISGRNASTGLVPAIGAATTVVSEIRAGSGSLAAGDQLGFTGQIPAVVDDPHTGEFPLGITQAVPVARSTVRAAVPNRSRVPSAPAGERRGDRRRRMGIPRLVTFRVFLFLLLLLAILAGAFAAVRWYAYENWFVTAQHNQVLVEQGRPGGVLWFKPKVVDHTGVKTSEILPAGLSQVHSHMQEPSLADAKHFVKNLHEEYVFLKAEAAKEKKAAAAAKKAEAAQAAAAAAAAARAATTTTTTAPGTTPTTAAATTTTVAP